MQKPINIPTEARYQIKVHNQKYSNMNVEAYKVCDGMIKISATNDIRQLIHALLMRNFPLNMTINTKRTTLTNESHHGGIG